MERLERVLQEEEFEGELPFEIAFHMGDWNWDAAFIVALHLFPERFTSTEINAGLYLFMAHAPYHVAEAARLMETAFEDEEDSDKENGGLSAIPSSS